jgi:predicted Zn-dependent protease
VVTDFIHELGQALVRQIEPQPFIYRFRVIDAASLNAFAVPGGYVYFHSGTITSAANVDELAAVMGHEIAHVKQHHYARMRKKSQIPDLLVGIAGMAAAIAAEEPGLLVASQAANVAMKLRYSREYEAEADQYGTVFMTRAGYDPKGSLRFFERILDEEKQRPEQIPPYLFSHPDVADRIESIEIAAERLQPTHPPEPDLARSLPLVQERLARLAAAKRTSLPNSTPGWDRERPEPALDAAAALADAAAERYAAAAQSYRRTVALDASRAKVFFQLGLSYREIGDRPDAVYAFEQAAVRAGETSSLRERANWEIFKLTFPVLAATGFADGEKGGDTPVGSVRESFHEGESRIAWWGRVNPRFRDYSEVFVLRWTGPDGRVVQEEPVKKYGAAGVGSVLEFEGGATPGTWSAELLLRNERIDRLRVTVEERGT